MRNIKSVKTVLLIMLMGVFTLSAVSNIGNDYLKNVAPQAGPLDMTATIENIAAYVGDILNEIDLAIDTNF